MLRDAGIDFDAYPSQFRAGRFVRRRSVERLLTDEEWTRIPAHARPDRTVPVLRTQIADFTLPPLAGIANRVAVLFEGADPLPKKDAA